MSRLKMIFGLLRKTFRNGTRINAPGWRRRSVLHGVFDSTAAYCRYLDSRVGLRRRSGAGAASLPDRRAGRQPGSGRYSGDACQFPPCGFGDHRIRDRLSDAVSGCGGFVWAASGCAQYDLGSRAETRRWHPQHAAPALHLVHDGARHRLHAAGFIGAQRAHQPRGNFLFASFRSRNFVATDQFLLSFGIITVLFRSSIKSCQT